MSTNAGERYRRFLGAWVATVAGAPRLVLLMAAVLTALCGWYAVAGLAIDTDTTDMLSPDLPFRQDARALDAAFPQLADTIAVVVDAATADEADDAASALAARLGADDAHFGEVFYPDGDPFFRRNGLLYLETGALVELVDRLAGAQAFLGRLWADPSLRGLFDVLALALENVGGADPPGELAALLDAAASVAEAQEAGRPASLSWREILSGEGARAGSDRRRIVVVQPRLDYGSLQPAGDAIAALREAARDLNLTPAEGVTVRLTGSAPLAEEELESVAQGMGLAGVLSFALVVALLLWGMRSLRLTAAIAVTLLMGLAWTAGFATAAVGRLNLISVAFAVLFIGLSVDFGIHFALRVREAMESGSALTAALRRAADSVGGSLTLCAAAAAISFFSFLPTNYIGLAELGLIAGGGMVVALVANLTVVPAVLALVPPRPRPWVDDPAQEDDGAAGALVRHRKPVLAAALVLAVGAAALLPQARFDFDPMNLRDPATESMSTLFDLMKEGAEGPYTIDVLAPDLATANALAGRLDDLKPVESARTLSDYVPRDQDEKLIAIEQAALFLLPSLGDGERAAPPTGPERAAAVERMRAALAKPAAGEGELAMAARRLDAALAALGAGQDTLIALERRLLETLPRQLEALRTSLEAGPVTIDDLPEQLRRRMVAPDGRARIEVLPAEDVRDRDALRRFVAAVRGVAPRATGAPVVILEAGDAVTGAFVKAAVISILAIGLLIAVLLRRLRDVLLVFAPLALSALLTVASTVLLGMPFNFANVIVLPLLFGLGVASAVHLVMRARRMERFDRLFRTSTPRAVVFSALTTIGSFASLGLSSHPGTSSMGILLTVAISITLLCTLVVLPALMAAAGGMRDS